MKQTLSHPCLKLTVNEVKFSLMHFNAWLFLAQLPIDEPFHSAVLYLYYIARINLVNFLLGGITSDKL